MIDTATKNKMTKMLKSAVKRLKKADEQLDRVRAYEGHRWEQLQIAQHEWDSAIEVMFTLQDVICLLVLDPEEAAKVWHRAAAEFDMEDRYGNRIKDRLKQSRLAEEVQA